MQFSDALEVAIGLSFIFLLLSLVMTGLQETVESRLKLRGARLIDGFMEMFDDPERRHAVADVVKTLYEHPLIHSLYRGDFDAAKLKNQLPSYIPSRNFALALIGQVLAGRIDPDASHDATLPPSATPVEQLRLAAERIQSEPLRRAVLQAVDGASGDMARVQKNLEAWFDSGMDRVSGWYRRQTHHFAFIAGLVMAVGLNVNALVIADGLSQNATLRRAVAAGAEGYAAEHRAPVAKAPAAAETQVPKADAASAAAQPPAASAAGSAVAPAAPAPATSSPAPDAPSASSGKAEAATESAKKAGSPEEAVGLIQSLGVPIGWGVTGRDAYTRAFRAIGPLVDAGQAPAKLNPAAVVASIGLVITWLVGWLMTALAITLGAPFWFDLLNKLVVIRATVKPHEKSREEGSQDHQDKKGVNITVQGPAPGPAGEMSGQFDDHDPVVDQLNPADRPREGDEHDPAAQPVAA